MTRRNLTPSQRAAVAAEAIDRYSKQAEDRHALNGGDRKSATARGRTPIEKSTAAADAAKDMGSSERSTERALFVQRMLRTGWTNSNRHIVMVVPILLSHGNNVRRIAQRRIQIRHRGEVGGFAGHRSAVYRDRACVVLAMLVQRANTSVWWNQGAQCWYNVNMAPQAKTETFTMRVAEEDLKVWRALAEADDLPLSDWIRRQCRAAAAKLKKK